MIKITLDKPKKLESDYLLRMIPPLQEMIDCLKLSLADLASPSSITVNQNTIGEYNDLTAKIIMIVEEEKTYVKKNYDSANYAATVRAYTSMANNSLADIDILKIQNFLNDLSAGNSKKLKEFLICPADRLSKTNSNLITLNSLNDKEIKVICLAISYSVANLSNAAKVFFRKHNLVKTCPYCNCENAEYKSETRKHGTVSARVHQLDHFFSQTDHPLLELCMYNLVPSGISCNSRTCKGQICFKDEFHLNPYIDGFNSDLKFVPDRNGLQTMRIKFDFLGVPGGSSYNRIMGDDTDTSPDAYKKGNVNVFKLRGVYEGMTEEADFVLGLVEKRLTGVKSNLRFFKKMVGFDWEANHKKWYKDEIRTPFDPEEFNDKPFSKFNRDIHDSYVMDNLSSKNNFLLDLIKYP